MEHEKYINNLIINKQIIGLNTCIIHDDMKIVKASGLKSIIPKKELTDNKTLYDIASLTKVVTTLPIICRLIDNKEINFNTKANSILKNLKYDDITIYDMLVHQSGLPSSINMNNKEQSKESLIKEIYKLDKSYKTGSKIVYSDIGYILLGLLIEEIYNKSFDKVANEEVFMPLNMNNTTFNPNNKENCAPTEYKDSTHTEVYQGIVHDWKSRMMEGISGHAGVFTTANDIGNYMKMALNKGYYNNKQYISEELINIWYKTLEYEKDSNRYRSLCWIKGNNKYVIKQKNDNIISFHGFTGTSISLDREDNIGICLLSNSVHPLRENREKLKTLRPTITDKIYDDYINNN